MEPKDLRAKLDGILEAIAAGRTCEEILAADRSLSYHDIFHAVAEAPTSYWDKASAGHAGTTAPAGTFDSVPGPARHRTD